MSGPLTIPNPAPPRSSPPSRSSPPPLARDPWAWVTALLALPLLWGTRGTPRGEAVAEDFDFLRRALLEPGLSLLDGGGSSAFWRPVSHQLYYETIGRLILDHPAMVSAIHLTLLGAAALLIYSVLRPHWPGPMAASAAAFPLLAESTRTLVCWPSHFVDLGAYLFLALAMHQASRRRVWSTCAALLAALLCKELALIGALLIPFLPGAMPEPATKLGIRRTERRPLLIGVAITVVAWAATYAWVRGHAGLELPHGLERDPAVLNVSIMARAAWALWNSLRAVFSQPLEPDHAVTAVVTVMSLAALATLIARGAAARERWRDVRGWVAWGAVWCVLSWGALASIFPFWAPNRSQLGSVGFGIGAVALAHAAHPALPLVLTAARLVLFAAGPGTPAFITPEPEDRGAFMDYPRLSRLQQLMVETRRRVRMRFGPVPPGSTFGVYNLPLSTEYAFGGGAAFQVWYRDTTLRLITYDEFRADPRRRVLAFLDYQATWRPQVALLDGDAVRAQGIGLARLVAGDWRGSLAMLWLADSLQRDRNAVVFLGDLAGRRAYCLAQMGRWDEADIQARAALGAAQDDVGARYVVALVQAVRGDRRQAGATLDTLLAQSPRHEEALALRRTIDSLYSAGR